jgi:hypothetical protein
VNDLPKTRDGDRHRRWRNRRQFKLTKHLATVVGFIAVIRS